MEIRRDVAKSRAVAAACLALAMALALQGCPAPTGSDLPPRYARKFLPFDPAWIPESEVPKEPQDSPMMVIWEFTETLEEPGPEEERIAKEWVERCYESAKRHGWHDFAKGKADGFRLMADDECHYENREYLVDDRLLDPDRPEFLMYYPMPDGSQALAGFMFLVRSREERGPQFAGRLTLWHYHVWNRPNCVVEGVISLGFIRRGERCPVGETVHRSAEMMHTWLIDNPKGSFATAMFIPPDVLLSGVEKRRRERGF